MESISTPNPVESGTTNAITAALRIPNRLPGYRRALGYTQAAFAAMHGMSRRRVGAWERNAFTDRDLDLLRLTVIQGLPPVGLFPELIAALRADLLRKKAAAHHDDTLHIPPVTIPPVVLGLNPGGRFIHWAVFVDLDLRDWGLIDLNEREDRSAEGLQAYVTSSLGALLARLRPDRVALAEVPDTSIFAGARRTGEAVHRVCVAAGMAIEAVPQRRARLAMAGRGATTKVALARQLVARYPCLCHDLALRGPAVPGRAFTVAPQAKGLVDALCVGLLAAKEEERRRAGVTIPSPA